MHRNDMVLMAIITCLAVFFIVFGLEKMVAGPKGAMVQVTVEGRVVDTIPLTLDDHYNMQFQDKRNGFDVRKGQVKMTAANCPDGLCLHQKAIQYENETIVCLPHRLVLKVVGGEDKGVDAVAY